MHPSFFLWTFNEIDALDSSNTDQMNFAQDIGSYIRSIDPYHPFTISYTGSGAGYPPLEKLSQIGAADIHFYGAITGTAAVPKENETATTRDGGYMNFGKPLVLSEWGVARKANTDDLVNAVMWGGIGIGTSGTGMVWTDRYTYGSFTPAQLAIMQNLSTFIGKLDWPNLTSNHHASSTEVTSSSRGVTPYASLDQTHAIVLLVAGSVGSSTATTVTINGLAPSHLFNIEIWSTYAGTRTSTGTITGTSSLTLSSSSSGSLVFATPSVPTMQALYIH
jgi:hypothetical protein